MIAIITLHTFGMSQNFSSLAHVSEFCACDCVYLFESIISQQLTMLSKLIRNIVSKKNYVTSAPSFLTAENTHKLALVPLLFESANHNKTSYTLYKILLFKNSFAKHSHESLSLFSLGEAIVLFGIDFLFYCCCFKRRSPSV